MGNFLYNGVELPALPEWDEATYPNAYIMESSLGSGTYALHVSVSKLHLNASDYGEMMWEIDASPRLIYSFDTSTWNESISTSQGAYEIDRLLWTNYDILGDDGETVLFAASDPVPVEEDEPKRISLDPTALLMGWLVGKRVAGLRKTQTDVPVVPDEPDVPSEPIAYLYNGVRLPDINQVWTDELKAQYPYAYIRGMGGDEFYYELLFASRPFGRINDSLVSFDVEVGLGSGKLYYYDYAEGENGWLFYEDFEQAAGETEGCTDLWTSHDIPVVDDNWQPTGTTYLAASEPVPVYE